MTHRQKAIGILAIIMDELNVPEGSTLGDIGWYLDAIDDAGEIKRLLTTEIRNAVIDEIKAQLA
jgi:hypothetical protein